MSSENTTTIQAEYQYDNQGRPIIPVQEELINISKDGGELWNRLVFESSPYLLQHAANPVDWYPWGDEAFQRAKELDKPIFLSIGYTTCHWCHVMEHESFENDEVAGLMNDAFVCVKVDREERPDIDNVYMEVTQMMNNRGGWPMTVIMTPDKQPFFTGTYFPKTSRGRRIGMMELIPKVKDVWQNNRDSLITDAANLTKRLQRNQTNRTSAGEISPNVADKAFSAFSNRYDEHQGGFGQAPKFPKAHDYSFLVKYFKRTGTSQALSMAEYSLKSMRNGGMYDQVGFGFHRYSTDARWLVPHFEKMLYDQAILVQAYLDAYQATEDSYYSTVVDEILEYVLRDMTSPEGGFYSAEDADSEGEEGKFYVWNVKELDEILGSEDSEFYQKVFNIRKGGNWNEGYRHKTNIPHLTKNNSQLASEFNITEKGLTERIEIIRTKLFNVREDRIHPQKDDKILTDWNGLMIAAMARAGAVLNNDKYAKASQKAMDFILENLMKKDGSLMKRHRNGNSGLTGVLDDYAFTIWALIELYEMNYNEKYLEIAMDLSEYQIDQFWDFDNNGFYFTASSGEQLLVRSKEVYDGAIPSGNSVSAFNFIRLARMTSRPDFEDITFQILNSFSGYLNRSSSGYSMMMQAAEFAFGPSHEVLVFGDENKSTTQKMLEDIQSIYMPNRVIVYGKSGGESLKNTIPFVGFYQPNKDGSPRVYVCQNFSCKLPTSDFEVVKQQLGVN
ncbi:MAG: thioredoxin domain-containing protein [Candidatus Marinimicrobia bacterium]|nr:thioredoxin domain-containing protein [Candidatus Neomarinimicrobiota bacterium]